MKRTSTDFIGKLNVFFQRSVILFIVSLSTVLYAQQIKPYCIPFNLEDQTTATAIHAIVQDSHGFVWLATDKGVVRFDGVSYVQYDLSQLSPSNEFYGISKDTNGRFWFFSADRLLVSYNFQEDKFYPSPLNEALKETTTGVVHSIQWSKNHVYLDCNTQRIIHLYKENVDDSDSTWQLEILSDLLILSIENDYRKIDITIEDNQLVHRMDGDSLFKLGNIFSKGYRKRTIFETTNSTWIASCQLLLNIGANGEVLFKTKYEGFQTPAGLFQDSKGRVWLSFFNKGVATLNHSNSDGGLNDTLFKNQTITSFYENEKGDLWISTLNNGFYLLSEQQAVKHSFEGEHLSHVGLFGSDELLFTRSGMIYKKGIEEAEFKPFFNILFEPISIKHLNTDTLIAISRKGIAFIYNLDGSLQVSFIRQDEQRISLVFGIHGKYSLMESIRLGADSVLIRDKENTKQVYWPVIWLNSKMKISNSRGDIFSVNFEGLHSLFSAKTQSAKSIEDYSGLRNLNHIKGCRFLDDDRIQLIDHSGVYIWNITVPDSIEKIVSSSSFDIKSFYTNQSSMWAGTSIGLRRFTDVSENSIEYIIPTNENSKVVNDFFFTKDHVMLATNDGYFQIRKDRVYKAQMLHIYEVRNGEKLNLKGRETALPSDFANLSISWSDFNFENKLKKKYRWRLGSNQAWTETNTNSVNLNSVGFGDYLFEVQMLNLTNEWGNSSTYKFSVERPYYLQLPFLSLCLILFIGIATVVVQLRIKASNEKLLMKENLLIAQNQALASQLNPHFIFNSMNTVSSLIAQEDDIRALKYISKLSILMRRIFTNAQKPSVSLNEELNSVFEYIEMEQLRFGEKLKFEFINENNTNLNSINVPSMLIQPFAENSIKHGILVQENGGSLVIKVEEEQEHIHVLIQDDGPGIDKVAAQKRKASSESSMSAIQKRLDIIRSLKQEGAILNIVSSEKGVTVTLTFKKY